ncbi:uncharacterized protein LOC130655757 isoform X2 [Hydractinia symbiolongicarpus]|uniref:uncharacterized protein LOC130655757 isoform X2 n=1 Tax=Hydractinia symbiolongicarpus TaxID=13093 RepID=UPI00254CCA06|nr:uncharacterized protein LOC130655757 isoform X2 [Hydractinia symbiolongicarpus]
MFLVFFWLWTVVDARCIILFTELSGTISSHSISNEFKNTDCVFKIETPKNTWIKLEWTLFTVSGNMPDCDDDSYLKVTTGCDVENFSSKFCGSNTFALPHDIYSKDNCMKIEIVTTHSSWRADTLGSFEGRYHAYSYTVPPADSSCSRYGRNKDVILSPQWPIGYGPDGYTTKECSWYEYEHKSTGIKINIMDLDVGQGSTCGTDEYLKFAGLEVKSGAQLKSFVFCKRPPYSSLQFHRVEIKMSLRNGAANKRARGFAIGYIRYSLRKGSVDKDGMDVGTIIGVVFGSLALFLFIVYFVAHKTGLGSTVTVDLVNLQTRQDNTDQTCHSDVGLLLEQREETATDPSSTPTNDDLHHPYNTPPHGNEPISQGLIPPLL